MGLDIEISWLAAVQIACWAGRGSGLRVFCVGWLLSPLTKPSPGVGSASMTNATQAPRLRHTKHFAREDDRCVAVKRALIFRKRLHHAPPRWVTDYPRNYAAPSGQVCGPPAGRCAIPSPVSRKHGPALRRRTQSLRVKAPAAYIHVRQGLFFIGRTWPPTFQATAGALLPGAR